MGYDNTNRFALWFNNKREKSTQPHLQGKGDLASGPMWVAAWFSQDINEADRKLLMGILSRYDSKKPFLSVSLSEPRAKQDSHNQTQPQAEQTQQGGDFDDDIPFNKKHYLEGL
jgi:hypothetical protein